MSNLQQKMIARLMTSAENVDGWGSDAVVDTETGDVTAVYVNGYVDVQHITSEVIAALTRWADASPAVTWSGRSGLKERILHPEWFKPDGTRIAE
jgi:hypothetical protein